MYKKKRKNGEKGNSLLPIALVIGLAVTICFSFLPRIIDPWVNANLVEEELSRDMPLGRYLSNVWDEPNVIVALHGYSHTTPNGDDSAEFYSEGEEIPTSYIEDHVERAMMVFNSLGIKEYLFEPPGFAWDERLVDILEEKGFTVLEGEVHGRIPTKVAYSVRPMRFILAIRKLNGSLGSKGKEILNVLSPKAQTVGETVEKNLMIEIVDAEYTWNWRYMTDFDDLRYEEALRNLKSDNPTRIILHYPDLNEFTKSFLEEAVKMSSVKIIRCDDIKSDSDLSKIDWLIDLGKRNNVFIELVVVPTVVPSIAPWARTLIHVSWYLFLWTVVLPTVTFVMWFLFGWYFIRRKKLKSLKKVEELERKPLVSIILPAYNEEKIIGDAIERAISQDYGNVEVIVVDDGSTDRTREIAESYAKKYDNVKLITNGKNRGKPLALNIGTKAAKGEIILHTDSDSYLCPDFLSKIVPYFEDPEVGAVTCLVSVDNGSNLLTKLQQMEYIYEQLTARFCQSLSGDVLICPGAASAFRAEYAKNSLVSDRTVAEDADYTFEARRRGWKVLQEPDAVSFTEAPENLKELTNQRLRWLYGVLQTIREHRWSWRDGWVLWAWLGYFLSPLIFGMLISIPILALLYGNYYLAYFIPYLVPTFLLFGVTRWIPLHHYRYGKQGRLAWLAPLYWLYNVYLSGLTLYCFISWLTGKGVKVRYGGRVIHAV